MKRFNSEKEILDEIDATKKKAMEAMIQSESRQVEIKGIKMRGDPGEFWLIDQKNVESRKWTTKATNLLERRIPYLGEKLAEFRTLQLPVIDNGDPSIPV